MSNIVTSVNTNVSVKGNSKTLGLTADGALFQQSNEGLTSISGYVNSNAGTNVSGASWNNTNLTVGITTDPTKSGLVGIVTRTQIDCNYIIKY